ncbi:MAG: LytTR family DNA-binding domain-containing protein [Lachnospiraceae bacterium]|nr:LytTR family DNA-binding domain-containing protein [Lachnospiraceae bacterium]
MKLKIAVCDDNKADQNYVISSLRRWAEKTNRIIEIHTFLSAEQFLFQYEEEKDFHILVLDIEMQRMNGVELAKKLRLDNRQLQILFVTGYPDFMAEGYEVDALHYLIKPVDPRKLFRVLEKAADNLTKTEKVLLLQDNGELRRLIIRNILFVEVFSHSCTLHTTEGIIETRISIGELGNRLGEAFIRVHRSYLVNLGQIKRIAKTDIFLEDGSTVPLARRKYTEVNLAFIRYFGGGTGAE